MSQSKKISTIEAITNAVVGLLFTFLIQLIIYPALDLNVSIEKNGIITLVFFLASILRSYLIRRFFNGKFGC